MLHCEIVSIIFVCFKFFNFQYARKMLSSFLDNNDCAEFSPNFETRPKIIFPVQIIFFKKQFASKYDYDDRFQNVTNPAHIPVTKLHSHDNKIAPFEFNFCKRNYIYYNFLFCNAIISFLYVTMYRTKFLKLYFNFTKLIKIMYSTFYYVCL